VEFRAQVGDRGRIAVFACHRDGRIAGQELLQAEDQHRHEEERRNDRGKALEEEIDHDVTPA